MTQNIFPICRAWAALAVISFVVRNAPAEVVTTFTDFRLSTIASEGSRPSWQLPNAFSNGGLHGYDINGQLNGNQVFVATQLAGTTSDPDDNPGLANTDVGFTFSAFSNGENGQNCSTDNFLAPCGNTDTPNTLAPNPAIQAANGGDPTKTRLQAGNVIRFSAWMRYDPAFPLNQVNNGNNMPSVEPLVKIELWKEALGTLQDVSALNPYPAFGDRIFDNQLEALNLGSFPSQYKVEWVDLGGDGEINFDANAASESRTNTLNANTWTLVEVDYELDPQYWLGIGYGGPTASANLWTKEVSAIEEIRGTFYFGDWSAADGFSQDLVGGNILVDNLMVEVFANASAAAATPNSNPIPVDGPPPIEGDFDTDGDVDGRDFLVWQRNPSVGDLADWQGNYGNVPPFSAIAVVPEPASVVLMIVGVATWLSRHDRQGISI